MSAGPAPAALAAEPRRVTGGPLAVVLGRFLPVHNGHLFLLETALGEGGPLLVVVRSTPLDPIAAELRIRWLRLLVQGQVLVVQSEDPRRLDPQQADHVEGWARRVQGLIPPAWAGLPRLLLAGEAHAAPLASALGASLRLVDRGVIPVSGTQIRNDPEKYAHFLPPPVQHHLGSGGKISAG